MILFNTKIFDNIISFIEKWFYIFLIAILLLSSVNIFYNLGEMPIYSWDEARHGVNAYEMISRNNYIVSTYAYEADYWNLKPPMSYWAIILGYKLVGFNALGLRIFSGFAALITIITVSIFCLHTYGRLASLISTSVLSTTIPYILEHCARTGDADAIFTLFFTLSLVSLYLIGRNIRWFYLSGFAFSLAFLTKSWHSGNIVIIGFTYLLISRILFKLKLKHIACFICFSSMPIILWMILRYNQDGFTFFKTMISFDLISRTSTTLEGHIGGPSYYLDILQCGYFPWSTVLISSALALTALIKSKSLDKDSTNYVFILLVWISTPLLLYSIAKTKISWYIIPIYPAMAISIGATSSLLLKHKNRNLILQFILSVLIVFSICRNENIIFQNISSPKADPVQELIKNTTSLTQYRGEKIYIHHFEQSYLLSAELYYGLVPKESGIEGFLKDNSDKTLLLITKDYKEAYEQELHKLKIVSENEEAYILTK